MDGQLKINLREQPTLKCENCESEIFKEVVLIKKVSKLMTGSSEDTIVPFPTYVCALCNHMNEEFKVFEN
jgi:hypothetical protein